MPHHMAAACFFVAAAVAQQAPAAAAEISPAQRQLAEDLVRKELKDPPSALFEGLVARPDANGRSLHICGWVNARNSFGGYVGRKPFYAIVTESGRDGLAMIDEDNPQVLAGLCAEYGLPLE
jgi:hypothetical protein